MKYFYSDGINKINVTDVVNHIFVKNNITRFRYIQQSDILKHFLCKDCVKISGF